MKNLVLALISVVAVNAFATVSPYSYAISNKGNCKVMINDEFTQTFAADYRCEAAPQYR